jgi:hypothetical protein
LQWHGQDGGPEWLRGALRLTDDDERPV